MKSVKKILIVFVFVCVFASIGLSQRPPGGGNGTATISGRVTNDVTGLPVPNITVTAYYFPNQLVYPYAITDSNGDYTITVGAAKTYQVETDCPPSNPTGYYNYYAVANTTALGFNFIVSCQ